MTYRKGFAPMYRCVRNPSADEQAKYIRLTSDAGWGCMIRVGQMLLATALKRHQQQSLRQPGGVVRRAQGDAGLGDLETHDNLDELRRQEVCAKVKEVRNKHAESCEQAKGGSGASGASPLSLEKLFLDDPRADCSPFSIFAFIRAAYGREVTAPESATSAGTRSAATGQHAAAAPRAGGYGAGCLAPGNGGNNTSSEEVCFLDANGGLSDGCDANCDTSDGHNGGSAGSSGGGGYGGAAWPPPLPPAPPARQLTEKKPGDWFGPTTVSETIAALVERNADLRGSLAVYVDSDGVMYEDEVRALGRGDVAAGVTFSASTVTTLPPTATTSLSVAASSSTPSASRASAGCDKAWVGEDDDAAVSAAVLACSALEEGQREQQQQQQQQRQPSSPSSPLQPAVSEDFLATTLSAPPPSRQVASGRKMARSEDFEEFEMVSTNSVSARSSPWASPLLAATLAGSAGSQSPKFDSGAEFEEARSTDIGELQVNSPMLRADGPPPEEAAVGGEQHWEMDGLDCGPLPPPALGLDADVLDGGEVAPALSRGRRAPPGDAAGKEEAGHADDGQASSAQASSQPARWNRAVLLLFPLQLGLEKHVSDAHVNAVLRYFELPSSLGAMGGRPRMAHFFVGRRCRELLYVDPHVVQPAAVSSSNTDGDEEEGETFVNTPTVQTIPVEHIDSSISFAFYCQSEADLRGLLAGVRRVEAAEANAPIRAEKTRPPALRPPGCQGPWRCPDGAAAWCDLIGFGSFTEDLVHLTDNDDEGDHEEDEEEEVDRKDCDGDDGDDYGAPWASESATWVPWAGPGAPSSSSARSAAAASAQRVGCGDGSSSDQSEESEDCEEREEVPRFAGPSPPTMTVAPCGGSVSLGANSASDGDGDQNGQGLSASMTRSICVGAPWAMIEAKARRSSSDRRS
jgi:hypothetical protein